MDDILAVKIVDGTQDLLDGLRGILLREFSLFADTVEQLSAGGEFHHNVVLVSRLEPVHKADDVGVLDALQHVQLVPNHLLVALDVLLQDDLNSHLARGAVALSDNAIGAGAEGLAESVLGLLIVTLGLPLEAVEHSGDYIHGGAKLLAQHI